MSIKSLRQYYAPDVAASTTATSIIQEDIAVYTTAADLPLTGNKKGQQAFVSSTNRLYIWNGQGWYNIATIASDLQLTQGANASYTLAKDGTATSINLSATSSNSVTWTYEVVEGSLTNGGGTTATVENVDGAFTITPTTTKDYQGTFRLKFLATDGTGFVGANAEMILKWVYWYGEKGVFAGGYLAGQVTTMDYINISTTGNAVGWGQLTYGRYGAATSSNRTYGVWSGGTASTSSYYRVMDYITFASQSSAIAFGTLTAYRVSSAGCSDGVYGMVANDSSTSDRFVIATPGNATAGTSLTTYNRPWLGACADDTYGVFAGGGGNGSGYSIIDYVTIANFNEAATSFGSLTFAHRLLSGCSNDTRGIFSGGRTVTVYDITDIQYITIQTPGNATYFGDMTIGREGHGTCSNGTRAVFGGAYSANPEIVDYITIDTLGNATSFGTLTSSRDRVTACSGQ